MAGSINLSLSQQFDKLNGNLLSGGRLYFYAAGTNNPQNAYKDTGLTITHPNPIVLASDGRVPQLYFADGSVHARLTNAGGVVQFDEDFVLVIGPSSGGGGGGGGGSVDASAVFTTGHVDWQPVLNTRTGWVRCNGLTIGSATSGATERSNADCQALFEFLWANYDNLTCPVSGRTTATNDWLSNKTIGLLDLREVTIGGLSAMGAGNRGQYGAVPVERGSSTVPGGIIGEIVHTLSQAEMPFHQHTGGTGGQDANHTHGGGGLFDASTTDFAGTAVGTPKVFVTVVNATGGASTDINSNGHAHLFTTDFAGSSNSHSITPRMMLGCFYIKL